jgi:hydrogenase-4 component E
MTNLLNILLVVVLLLNFFALGTSRIASIIRAVAIQGALLSLLPLLLHEQITLGAILMVLPALALKGIIIPGMMTHALRDVKIKREVEPLIGLQSSLILGALATVFALLFAKQLPLIEAHANVLIVPTSIATLLTGFILLTTRFKAITQVVGYLILENGIFIFGMLLVEAMPLVVEMAVLLDLFVGIFVITIIANQINQAFSSIDTRRLASLKE